jgi:hypothetical protein
MRWLPDRGVGVFVLANLTYAHAAALTRAALMALHETGALEARQPAPSPALVRVSEAVAQLLADWQDDRARALAAVNLFLDTPLEERKSAINRMRADLGSCRRGPIEAENALRGKFRLDCDHGWLNVEVTLAPVNPPKVQHLAVTAGKPASSELRQAAEALISAMSTGAIRGVRLAPAVNQRDLTAMLHGWRNHYGSCRLGEAVEGDGYSNAKFRVSCDRGPLDMTLSMNEKRISSASFAPTDSAVCSP